MRILVVAATSMEVAPLVAQLGGRPESGPGVRTCAYAGHDIDVLVTGVGMVATAARLARAGPEAIRPGAELRRVRQL